MRPHGSMPATAIRPVPVSPGPSRSPGAVFAPTDVGRRSEPPVLA